ADSVKLVDFGVAKLRAIGSDPSGVHTMEGALLGTITYMAPEQAAGGEIDPRADLYALGTTLYRMLAGHLPFGGPTFTQFAMQIVNDPPAPLPLKTSHRETIPLALRALVMRCLEKEPNKRPASASELQRALRQVASRTRRSRGLRHALVAASAVVAALAVSAAVLHSRSASLDPSMGSPSRAPSAPPPTVAAVPQPQVLPPPPAASPEPERPTSKKVRPTRRHRH
ncbi:MAG TPA: protein kinase, partial [Myxococcaceae bacterium]|nr:protein kinase [Myxococcaceae bacterium]